MNTLKLKDYQLKAMGALEDFFLRARGAQDQPALQAAFNAARQQALGDNVRPQPYRPLSQEAQAVPQVCIRIPTGGGKTLLAAHAIERAARLLVGSATPLALWLVPSNTIRTQTLAALKTPGHPYREALLQYYPADRLTVIDIADCAQLRSQDFGGRAIVVVGTIQTLRVDNTASRDVYAYKECFEPHFANVPEAEFFERISERDIEAQPYLQPRDVGRIKRSFANLLAWSRPIVIVDEAHNARSDLSFEVFRRIRPACLIEWTATPAKDQNVLYHVSAQELKAENMIKLPIVLAPHPNWQENVRDAVLTRERLAEAAVGEVDYVRPIVLFQADNKDGEVPVAVLKAYLQSELHISESRIAIATGNQRGLDGIDLFDRACPVDFVITVEALKEGWDCSFAYVFCTVQNIRSAKDMEQLLGRVLRLPYATPRRSELLNRAYAHVCSPDTALVANQLADRLVAMGFEEMEAVQFVQPQLDDDLFGNQSRMPAPPPTSVLEASAAAADALLAVVPHMVSVLPTGSGAQVSLTGLLPEAAIDAVLKAVPKKEREQLGRLIERHQLRTHAALSPAQRGESFGVLPQLCVPLQGELCLLEPDLLPELLAFSLAGAAADLPDFQRDVEARPYLIDVERGRLCIALDSPQAALNLNGSSDAIRREDIIRALDLRVRRDGILQPDMIAWLGRLVDGLLARGIDMVYMARHIGQLSEASANRLRALEKRCQQQAFQQTLLDGPAKACLADHYGFRYDRNQYPARWLFAGRFNFEKHFYGLPGELDEDLKAEETACAIEIERLPEVKFWVRNLALQPRTSFWLPTSTDRFYPDFVAELDDGRMMVIEYKGADRATNEDTREKNDIGKVWAAASNGRCLFGMITDAKQAGRSVTAQLRMLLDGQG